MAFDWLKSLRTTLYSAPRRSTSYRLATPTSLESRTLLSALPVGPEFQVNTWTTSDQNTASIGMDADGDYVITWQSSVQDGSGYGIYAQRYDAAGVAQGPEFLVNTWTFNLQTFPSIGMDAEGDFVIAWTSQSQDGSVFSIYAQRYNKAGVAQGSEFRVNTWTTDRESKPTVGMDSDGDFVIAWQGNGQNGDSYEIYAQRFNAEGVSQGSEFRVNTWTTDTQYHPRIAMDRDGDFVITWESTAQDGDSSGIYAQRYNPQGVAQGSEFRVNSTTTNLQEDPSVGMDADGNFIISWTSDIAQAGLEIYAQRYNAVGEMIGSEFHVNTWTTGLQIISSVAMDADGGFVISWSSYAQDGSDWGIIAQQFNAQGVPQGSEFRVNTWTTGSQPISRISLDADGDFVIAWESAEQDGDVDGIYAQRFRVGHPDNPGIWRSSKFYLDSDHSNTWSGAVTDTLNTFGASTDKPLVGDWYGDGYDDIGIWRAGTFYLDSNGNGIWDGPAVDQKFIFGNSTDTPIVGDWNSDGKSDIGVWRAGKFYLDLDGNHAWNTGFDAYYSFGSTTDTPIVGDWNGDGTDDLGIWRVGKFYLDLNGNRVWNSGVDGIFTFGNSSDTPIIGDWNGDGIDDIGIWRAGKFYQDADGSRSWNSSLDAVISFGSSTDTPLIGYWRPKTLPGTPPAAALLPGAASTITTSSTPKPSPAPSTTPELLASLLATPAKKINRWEEFP